jgi:secreted PhoX family phosphatase
MGRFNHEAVAVDPGSGVVFETEDRGDSLFYRFIPARKGDLRSGRLQALSIGGMKSVDASNREKIAIAPGFKMRVRWVDLEDVESPKDNLRRQGAEKGAARFARGEGMWATPEAIYFACTSGGPSACGQIFRYFPQTETLELFAESPGDAFLDSPDNISIAPWGDLLACEDRSGNCRIVGITPDGRYYTLARNALNDSELVGGVFSPDGSTLFVSIQNPGLTLAITGPWKQA